MERSASPASNTGSFGTASPPPSSPVPDEDAARNDQGRKKKTRKKRKTAPLTEEVVDGDQSHLRKPKKAKSRRKVSNATKPCKHKTVDSLSNFNVLQLVNRCNRKKEKKVVLRRVGSSRGKALFPIAKLV